MHRGGLLRPQLQTPAHERQEIHGTVDRPAGAHAGTEGPGMAGRAGLHARLSRSRMYPVRGSSAPQTRVNARNPASHLTGSVWLSVSLTALPWSDQLFSNQVELLNLLYIMPTCIYGALKDPKILKYFAYQTKFHQIYEMQI